MATTPDTKLPAKSTAERVATMRANRDALGLKRLEIYAHPDDWEQVKKLAARLQRKRDKQATTT